MTFQLEYPREFEILNIRLIRSCQVEVESSVKLLCRNSLFLFIVDFFNAGISKCGPSTLCIKLQSLVSMQHDVYVNFILQTHDRR